MRSHEPLVFQNVKNVGILSYLRKTHFRETKNIIEFSNDSSYLNLYRKRLTTHPESVDYLWNEIIELLPLNCNAAVFSVAVLINPYSGIIFGVSEGTYPVLLRLPIETIKATKTDELKSILTNQNGVYADSFSIGPDWSYLLPTNEKAIAASYCLKAFQYSLS